METSVKITLIIVATIVLLALGGIFWFNSLKPGQTVDASGIAEIKAVPDIVGVYFNVETKGNNATEARDKNAEIVDKLLTELIKNRFERDELMTENFNVYPDYQWINGQYKEKGYRAVHSLRLEIGKERMDDIGEVIDAGVNAGASISYINFELSQAKQNEYKALALKQATEDAKIKAEAIASGLGKKIGDVVSISTSDFNYYPWRLYESVSAGNLAEAKQATTNIQPSEQTINAQVQVTFKIV